MKVTILKFFIMLLAVPPSVALTPVVDIYGAVTILVILFFLDLGTGLLASYFEWKKVVPKGKYFFRANDSKQPIPEDQKGFSSDKFKKCWFKGIIYGLFPLVVIKFQQVFLLKNVSFSSITTAEMDIATICILIFCFNELFSIFWENLPKCGLNIPKLVRDAITGGKGLKNDINELTN